jgi:hypothetical protein
MEVARPCWPAPVSAMSFFIAEELGQQRLAHAVVQLVGAGVVEVFVLQVDAGAVDRVAEALAVITPRRTALEMCPDRA